jgi:hypothetical protein
VYHSRVHWFFVFALLCIAAIARAGEGDDLFERAEADDAAGRYAQALDEYRAAIARAPSSRHSLRAIARAETLASHAEGDFAPFAELEEVRRTPGKANDPREIERLARDAESFPAGAVRVEARMLVAEAYIRRMGRRDEGIAELRRVTADPAADPLTARMAGRALVETLEDGGDLDGASEAAKTIPLDPRVAARVRAHVRRRWAHWAAIADLAVFSLLAAIALGAAARRRELEGVARALRSSLPIAIAFAAYVALAGGVLAAGYERGNAAPFLAMGAVSFPLALLSRAWGAAGSNAPSAKGARAALCASSVVAAAFLVLEHVNAAYLEGFGL